MNPEVRKPEGAPDFQLHETKTSDYKTYAGSGQLIYFGRSEDDIRKKWESSKNFYGAKLISSSSGNKERIAAKLLQLNHEPIDVEVATDGHISKPEN